jgi:hypothetical protein
MGHGVRLSRVTFNNRFQATRETLAPGARRSSFGDTVQSVRHQLVSKFDFATRKCDPDETLGDAVYALLRVASEIQLCVDGWEVFRVKSETNEHLEAVGLMTLLPSWVDPRRHQYSWKARGSRVVCSVRGREWSGVRCPNRKVYLYATESGTESPWTWGQQYRGFIGYD